MTPALGQMICAWCEAPATTVVEVKPVVIKVAKGERKIVTDRVTRPACPVHSTPVAPPQPPKRRKPGPEQTTVFDFLDGDPA